MSEALTSPILQRGTDVTNALYGWDVRGSQQPNTGDGPVGSARSPWDEPRCGAGGQLFLRLGRLISIGGVSR